MVELFEELELNYSLDGGKKFKSMQNLHTLVDNFALD